MDEYAVLIDPENNVCGIIFFKDDLDYFYERLECHLVEIDERKIGKRICNVIADEEGLYTDCPMISAIDNYGRVMFVGPLIVAGGVDEEGNLHGLTFADAKEIQNLVLDMGTRLHPEPYPILTQVEYI